MNVSNNTEPARLWCIDARNGHTSITAMPAPVVGRAIGNSAGGMISGQNNAQAVPLLGRYTVRPDWDDGGAAAFTVQRLSDAGASLNIIRFTVCRNAASEHKALSFLGAADRSGSQLPFMCWRPVENNMQEDDDRMMTALLTQQKILAYAWLDKNTTPRSDA